MDEYSNREMLFGLFLLPVFKFVSVFIRAALRFTGIGGRSKGDASGSSRVDQQRCGVLWSYAKRDVSDFIKSCCCDAPITSIETASSYVECRHYIRCASCGLILDFYDDEIKELFDRVFDEEFIITRPIYAKDYYDRYSGGTLDERRNYWGEDYYAFHAYLLIRGVERSKPIYMINPN